MPVASAGRDDLEGFGLSGRRPVTLAEAEARRLGHGEVGTEHLLLGLLADDAGEVADRLTTAGITLAAARDKVSEAVGARTGAPPAGTAPMPRTARAARALGRAVRFSRARRSATVEGADVLEGVLDVEGTAGQVLRGLGLDVDRFRASLAGDEGAASAEPAASEPAASASPHCPNCGASLDAELVYRPLVATGEFGPRDALAFACGACGHLLTLTRG